MSRITLAVYSDNFYDAHLKSFVQGTDGFVNAEDVFNGLGHRAMGEENEGVAFAGGVALGNEERVHELRSVGYKVFEFAVDGIQGENRVFADV